MTEASSFAFLIGNCKKWFRDFDLMLGPDIFRSLSPGLLLGRQKECIECLTVRDSGVLGNKLKIFL